jgi:uncharacterized membrane protein HdeD (DUF308 family)
LAIVFGVFFLITAIIDIMSPKIDWGNDEWSVAFSVFYIIISFVIRWFGARALSRHKARIRLESTSK